MSLPRFGAAGGRRRQLSYPSGVAKATAILSRRNMNQLIADAAAAQEQQGPAGAMSEMSTMSEMGLVEAALPDLSPAQVDAVVAEINKRMTMGSKQCCLTAVLFQSEWLEGREMWLVVFGLQGNLYRVRCTACDLVLNSHLHTIQKHEDSARHKQNLAAKQKSSAAVQAFKAALTTGRDRTAAKRKEQMEDPATVTQFAAVFYLLKLGRPMTDIEHTPTSSESPGLQPLQPSTGKTTAHGRLQRPLTLSCASMTWRTSPPPAAPGPAQRPQAPPWGGWLDWDTNGCLDFQRIGESMQRPLELCQWEGVEALRH
ncbi:hypothetical protein QJQ45_002825 [Haematococcus lacustris]|nr:hypothetical protein QJQ45_002825 [Haematococcus lacustris]